MTEHAGTTSVFTDDSGARRRVMIWLVRGTIGAIALVAAAVMFTLVTHVSLPVLGGPLADLGNGGSPSVGADHSGGKRPESDPIVPSESPTTAVSDAARSDAAIRANHTPGAVSGSAPSTRPSTPSVTPTGAATPGSKANRGAASTTAPRATPTPRAPDKTPPGQSK